MKSSNEPKVGEYGWEGKFAPGFQHVYDYRVKFSVVIFPWVPTVYNGKQRTDVLKHGKVVYRVRGYCNDPQAVYKRADEVCEKLNEVGLEIWMFWKRGKKSETTEGKAMMPKNEILKLKHGERWIWSRSDFGIAEVWRIYNYFIVFEIPLYGGTPMYPVTFSENNVDELIRSGEGAGRDNKRFR